MNKFAEFESIHTDKPVFINVEHIVAVSPKYDSTNIDVSNSEDPYIVKEDYETVCNRIQAVEG